MELENAVEIVFSLKILDVLMKVTMERYASEFR